MHPKDLRYRIVSLIHICNMDANFINAQFFPTSRSIQRWHRRFLNTCSARDEPIVLRISRLHNSVVQNVETCVKAHPTFCIEELLDFLRAHHPNLINMSEETILRALNFDLRMTRKQLRKAAREAALVEIQKYYGKLKVIHIFPKHLVFLDESLKDRQDAPRSCSCSKHRTKFIVTVHFSHVNLVSEFADIDSNGFV